MHRSLQRACAAAVGASLFACASAEAGLSYVSQERFVQAANGIATSQDDFDPDNPVGVIENERITAPDFGPFDATASVEFQDPSDTDLANALASQQSTLDDDGLTASGRVDVLGDDRGYARSIFRVTFDVTADADYALSLDAAYSRTDPAGGTDRELLGLRFARLGDGGAETLLADESLTVEDAGEGTPPFEFDAGGRLEAGRDGLDLQAVTFNRSGQAETGTFDLSFTTTDVDDGGGSPGGPNPIPLPPAAWAGLITFAGYGATRALARRARRA